MASLSATQWAQVIELYNANRSVPEIAEDLKLPLGTVSEVIHQYLRGHRPARPFFKPNGFAPVPASLVTSPNLDSQLQETHSSPKGVSSGSALEHNRPRHPPGTTTAPRDPLLARLTNELQDQILHHYVRSRSPRQIMKHVNLGPGPVFEVINQARHEAGKSPIPYDVETAGQIADLFTAGWNPEDITQVLDLTEGGVVEIIDVLRKQDGHNHAIPGPNVVVPGPNSNIVLDSAAGRDSQAWPNMASNPTQCSPAG